MKCAQVRQTLAKTEILSDEASQQIQLHLRECHTCEAEAERWESFLTVWKANETPQASPETFLNSLHQRMHRKRVLPLRRLATVVASLILVISLASVAWFRHTPTTPSTDVIFPVEALETLAGTRSQLEKSILDVLEQSIITLHETEDETLCDEEIL